VLVQHLLMRTKPLPITTEAGHPLFADSLELIDDLRKARMIGKSARSRSRGKCDGFLVAITGRANST
jgi:hypothetical protein